MALILEHATQQPYVRRAAVQALAQLEAGALAGFAHTIVRMSSDAHSFVRKAVIEAMGGLLPTALLQHVNAVLARLEDTEEDVRTAAVTTLGRVIPMLTKQDMRKIINTAQVRAAAAKHHHLTHPH